MARSALYCGDNLEVMKALLRRRGACVDLIYIDPPFNSARNYKTHFDPRRRDGGARSPAFKDTWGAVGCEDALAEIRGLGLREVDDYLGFVRRAKPAAYAAYLSMMALRIYYMRALLKDSGGFYLHCDPTMSHYLKVVCDLIFGDGAFVNEIVWHYGKWSKAARRFQRNHDVILFYGKSASYKFNPQRQDYSPKTALAAYARTADGRGVARQDKSKPLDLAAKRAGGVAMHDTWDIPFIHPLAKERLGYPTQKPLALLRRIIRASSDAGDLVADFFCGSGVAIEAAIELGRDYIGVDISELGVALTRRRIKAAHNHIAGVDYDLF